MLLKNETFLHIAQTRDYTFSEITGKRTFSVHNANAFLDMRDGVLAGKQAILPRQATVMYVPGRKRAKHLSSVSLAVGGPTTKPINGVTQRNCWSCCWIPGLMRFEDQLKENTVYQGMLEKYRNMKNRFRQWDYQKKSEKQ